MTSSAGWQSLDLAQTNAPKLLLKTHITAIGYHVQLTDLCRVWSEQLCKKDILRRAWDEGCSIDPSEDDKQFSIFLGKVESALKQENGTTISLFPDDDNDGLLQLKLSAPMPKGFKNFLWTIFFARRTDEALAETLTVPLLQQASQLQLQVQQLVHELQEKDRVISKITDRLETSGNDLTTVFPGVSNVRTNKEKSQREQLARHVRGLADFDEAEWRDRASHGDAAGVWKGMDRVLSGLSEVEARSLFIPLKQKWWLNIASTAEAKPEAVASTADAKGPSQTANGGQLEHEESMQDDEFQRQATPDHLQRRPSSHSENSVEDEVSAGKSELHAPQQTADVNGGDSTTEDEDDLDAVTKSNLPPTLQKHDPSMASKSPSAEPSTKLGAIGDRSSKPSREPAREPTPEQPPQPSKPRAKLGALGGKAKASPTPAAASPPPKQPVAPAASSAPRKMGVIGGKRRPSEPVPQEAKSPDATPSPEPVKERSRATTKEPAPAPRETSQERADRKRDQLKKELEQKAKAPAKKKRKF